MLWKKNLMRKNRRLLSLKMILRNRMDQEVSSAEIGELVMDGLREIDEVAYVRFASVYRQFTDVDKFMQELQAIIRQKKD